MMSFRLRFPAYLVFLILVFLGISSCAKFQMPSAAEAEIVKSQSDTRQYRSLVLNNGLKVMLVSDTSADRAAASLEVRVGSGHNPVDRQGLAHYMEHMLFLGTEKYPDSGEYQKYINENGGSNNAYTALDRTNYFFNIPPEYFEGALDRFAQFFIAPLFNEEYVKRERAIVDSEYQTRKDDEGRRLWTARRIGYNPQHPSARFSVGNLETLADRENDPVREDLLDFYEDYYHASRMALAVVSSHSLDQLQDWVEAKFGPITGDGKVYEPFSEPLILPEQLPTMLTLKPIKETRRVTFSFPIDPVVELYDSKPQHYLSNLLGHEGTGSLLALLKKYSWANSLSAGMGYSDDRQATFDISINLSEKGFEHIGDIGSLLFAYIDLIKEQGIKRLYFDEQAQLAELDFRFQEKSEETSLVQGVASRLHRYAPQQVLSAPYLYESFRPELVENILTRLQPDNLQLIVVDPQLKSNQETLWYNVAYSVDEIDQAWVQQWRTAQLYPELALPAANPFIANDLSMFAESSAESDIPVKLAAVSGAELWHRTELKFGQPKANLYFSLRSAVANATPRQALLTELYVKSVDEALNTYTYPAYLAGLEYRIYSHSRGLSVRIGGYSAVQKQLLEKVLVEMQHLKLDPQRFEQYVEGIRRQLENSLKGRPSSVVFDGVYDVLVSSNWSVQEKLEALPGIDIKALEQHAKELLDDPELLVLSMGNVDEKQSIAAGQLVAQINAQAGPVKPVERARVRRLKRGQWTMKESAALPDDAAMVLVYQGSGTSIAERAMTQLLGSLIHTPYYQVLRTEGQFGYIVQAFALNMLDTSALGFSVQSNSRSVGEIVSATEAFLDNYISQLNEMPEADFEVTKAGLVAQLKQEDKQLDDVASRYWSELDRQAYAFDTRERMVEAVEALDKASVLEYLEGLRAKEQVAALLSYSFGNKARISNVSKLPNAVEYSSLQDIRNAMNDYF